MNSGYYFVWKTEAKMDYVKDCMGLCDSVVIGDAN